MTQNTYSEWKRIKEWAQVVKLRCFSQNVQKSDGKQVKEEINVHIIKTKI